MTQPPAGAVPAPPYPGAAPLPAGPAAPPAPTATLGGPVEAYAAGPAPAAPADDTWHAPAGGVAQAAVPPASEPAREPVRLAAPEQPMTPARPPAVAEERPRTTPLPVGIPQFAMARDGVASGLKPLVDGGLDWLAASGYHTVLHVVSPAQDDSADRQQVEKHGMKYVRLEVSPETLSPAVVEQFNKVVGDQALRPLFVYDKDGMLAGGLWYLHFRTAQHASDEQARKQASQLGLKEDAKGPHQDMWLAIQKYLSTAAER
jgi:hypothetical protein